MVAMAALGLQTRPADDPAQALHVVSLTEWTDGHKGFGGLSGLAMLADGTGFLAVSDRGLLIRAAVTRDGAGHIATVDWANGARFLDGYARPVYGFESDAEAIRLMADGGVMVAFEGYARVSVFHPPDMMPTALHKWDRFRELWGNQGMESLAISPAGQVMTILEVAGPHGAYRTLREDAADHWVAGPRLKSDGAFRATDAVWGPDGNLHVLERAFSLIWGYTSRISLYRPDGDGFSAPTVEWQSQAGDYQDFEGMDIQRNAAGRLVYTLISDNNFLPFETTTVAELEQGP